MIDSPIVDVMRAHAEAWRGTMQIWQDHVFRELLRDVAKQAVTELLLQPRRRRASKGWRRHQRCLKAHQRRSTS